MLNDNIKLVQGIISETLSAMGNQSVSAEIVTKILETLATIEGGTTVLDALTEIVKNQTASLPIVARRPQTLACDVVRFQNRKEKWVAFVGLLGQKPYEIFTGLQDDEEGIALPKSVNDGYIIKNVNADGTKRYDFQFQNRRGYKTTVEGLSEKFNPEYWNYAKLISGMLRYRMPIENIIHLIDTMELESESINTWKAGVARALKKYVGDEESQTTE